MELKLQKDRILAIENNKEEGRLLFLPVAPNIVNILSIHVDEEYRGHGIARQLMEAFIDYAKKNNKQIIPTCSYASSYFQKHTELSELLYKQ